MKILAGISRCAMAILVFSTATAVVQGQTPASYVLQATTYESHFPPAAKDGEAWNGIHGRQQRPRLLRPRLLELRSARDLLLLQF